VHHALAFNTLLSSQETDAYIRTGEIHLQRQRRTSRFLHLIRLAEAVKSVFGSSDQDLGALETYRAIMHLSNQPNIRRSTMGARERLDPERVTALRPSGSLHTGLALGPVRLIGVPLAPGASYEVRSRSAERQIAPARARTWSGEVNTSARIPACRAATTFAGLSSKNSASPGVTPSRSAQISYARRSGLATPMRQENVSASNLL